MADETRKRADIAVDTALKLRMMMELPTDFLKFVYDVEMDPTPENLARIERWNRDAADYLQKRVQQLHQLETQSAPEPVVQVRQFVN